MRKATRIRINISLPEETVAMLEAVAEKGSRSSLIDEAIKKHVRELQKARLRSRLKRGAIDRAERDAGIAGEWAYLEEDLWQE